MPLHNHEDLMPRDVPKPAPLVDMLPTPLAPEVSLLLDMDRNKGLNLQTYPHLINSEPDSENSPKGQRNELSYGNQHESYKSWNYKNRELLHTVTESSGSPVTTKRSSNSTLSYDIYKKMSPNGETSQNETLPTTQPLPNVNHVNPFQQQHFHNANQNFGHQPVDQRHNNSPTMPTYHTQLINSFPPYRDRDMTQPQQYQNPNICGQQKMCVPMESIGFIPVGKNTQIQNGKYNTQYDVHRPQNIDTVQGLDRVQCQCRHTNCGRSPINNFQYVNSQSCATADLKDTSNSPLDLVQANNKVILELYHVISLQNEQINILNEQVNKVLQIHKDCDNKRQQNYNCHRSVSQQRRNYTVSEKAACASMQHKDKTVSDGKSRNNTEIKDKLMRSIGVMTSTAKRNEDKKTNCMKNTKSPSVPKTMKSKLPQIIPNVSKDLPCQSKHRGGFHNKEDKERKLSFKPGLKYKCKDASQLDSSFSLNEAELVVRSESELDDLSPNTSVHIDLQVSTSSCNGSSSEDSSSSNGNSEDEHNSVSEDSYTEPQPSWTFYNRVVGQVNNILKKNPSPPQDENCPMYLTTPGNIYGPSAEAEDNWSKWMPVDRRRTDDRCQNVEESYMFDPRHDVRIKDGQGRMQDFMMYNFANGNTNLSFASMRYMDHHHLVHPQRLSKPDETYQRCSKKKDKKRRKKLSNSNKITDFSTYSSKRKNGTPSKLYDSTPFMLRPKLS